MKAYEIPPDDYIAAYHELAQDPIGEDIPNQEIYWLTLIFRVLLLIAKIMIIKG